MIETGVHIHSIIKSSPQRPLVYHRRNFIPLVKRIEHVQHIGGTPDIGDAVVLARAELLDEGARCLIWSRLETNACPARLFHGNEVRVVKVEIIDALLVLLDLILFLLPLSRFPRGRIKEGSHRP